MVWYWWLFALYIGLELTDVCLRFYLSRLFLSLAGTTRGQSFPLSTWWSRSDLNTSCGCSFAFLLTFRCGSRFYFIFNASVVEIDFILFHRLSSISDWQFWHSPLLFFPENSIRSLLPHPLLCLFEHLYNQI